MLVVWAVLEKNGLKLVRDSDVDIFHSLDEAEAEVKNRGPEYEKYILNKDDVINQLLRQVKRLQAENKNLRDSIDSVDDYGIF